MGEAYNVPQNALGKYLANKLYGSRNFLNEKFGIPFVDTGLGLGDMFMGESPEYIEDLSWGRPFIEASGHGGRLDTRLGDVLGLPLPYAGAGKIGQIIGKTTLNKLSGSGIRKTDDVLTDPSKRKAAKMGLGGIMGLAGVASMPKLAKGLIGDLATDATRVAATAAPRVAFTNPAAAKLANLLMGLSSDRILDTKRLVKVFKNKGVKGLEDELNSQGQKINFVDLADGDIDPDEVLNMINRMADSGESYISRNFKPLTPNKKIILNKEADRFIDDVITDDFDNFFFDQGSAEFFDQGYDPKEILKRAINRIKKNPDPDSKEFLDQLYYKMDHLDAWYSDLDNYINENSWRQTLEPYHGLDGPPDWNDFELFNKFKPGDPYF